MKGPLFVRVSYTITLSQAQIKQSSIGPAM